MQLYRLIAEYTVNGQLFNYDNLIACEDYTWTNITFWLNWSESGYEVKIIKYSFELLDEDIFKDGLIYSGAMAKDESMTFEEWLKYLKKKKIATIL